jgi:hypothetical protein
MPISLLNTSRSLSPTRSTIPWNSSFEAMPCWMLLITASSALRCAVSFSSRCVSAKLRALSSATPMLEATVVSRRSSASPKAFSRSWSSSWIVPSTRSLPTIGTTAMLADWSVPGMSPPFSWRGFASWGLRVASASAVGPPSGSLVGASMKRLPCS